MSRNSRLIVFAMFIGLMSEFPLSALASEPAAAFLIADGKYQQGVRVIELTDASREGRTLQTYIWYPAAASNDPANPPPPDASGGPYPLIIYSHGYYGSPTENVSSYLTHLVSQGYIVAAINHQDTPDSWRAIVNRPLDVLFLLNQLANMKGNALADIIDTEKVGVAGASAGSYTSLAVGGVRIDPNNLANWCSSDAPEALIHYCGIVGVWNKLAAYHDELEPPSNDGLWSATTDQRIRAVLPIAPCFGQLFGERGLTAISIPTLMIAGTSDQNCPYNIDAAYIYQHLGSADRYLVSLKNRDHNGVFAEEDLIEQYATAFFGYYLKGETDYAQYLTPDSARDFQDIIFESQIGDPTVRL